MPQLPKCNSPWSRLVRFSLPQPGIPGAGLAFAWEVEVTLRTALIGISAPVALMGCFPGTDLPCLKNALAAQPQPWVQPCPGCSCVGGSDLGALMPWAEQGAPPSAPRQGKRGIFRLPSNQFVAGEMGTVSKILRVDYFSLLLTIMLL